jgi:hypothetical protein
MLVPVRVFALVTLLLAAAPAAPDGQDRGSLGEGVQPALM